MHGRPVPMFTELKCYKSHKMSQDSSDFMSFSSCIDETISQFSLCECPIVQKVKNEARGGRHWKDLPACSACFKLKWGWRPLNCLHNAATFHSWPAAIWAMAAMACNHCRLFQMYQATWRHDLKIRPRVPNTEKLRALAPFLGHGASVLCHQR